MFEISRSALVLFGFELHWYCLLIALGVLAAVLLCRYALPACPLHRSRHRLPEPQRQAA